MKRSLALALSIVAVSAFAADSRKAIVLDSESKSVVVIDAATGTVGERVPLTDTPARMILSPDGKRLAVLSRGEGDTPKSSVTLIDLATMKPIARVQFDRVADSFSVDGSVGAIYFKGITGTEGAVNSDSLEAPKTVPAKPAELRLVDMATLDTVDAIPLSPSTNAPFALIKDRLYLVDDRDTQAGKAYVVNLSDRRLAATLDAGEGPFVGAVDPDSDNIYLLNSSGEMRVLNGTTMSAPVKVARTPIAVRFSEDKKTAYVLSRSNVTAVDLATMKPSQPIKTRGFSSDLFVSPDGRRGFVYEADAQTCCWATVLDLASNTQMKSFVIGSKGLRFAKALGGIALGVATYHAGFFPVYMPRGGKLARGRVAVRPDGKFAYYLDAMTANVTLVDAESGERLNNIGIGSGAHELVMLGNGKYLAAVTNEKVSIIDTDKNEVKTEIQLSGDVADFVLAPKSDLAAVIGRAKIAVIDTQNGSRVAMIDAFKRPSQLIFLD